MITTYDTSVNLDALQKQICDSLCNNIRLYKENQGLIHVETPFYFSDGDQFQMYLTETGNGVFRLSDMGHTFMHLSYENDTEPFQKGQRGKLLRQFLLELGLRENNGEFYIESTADSIAENIFTLGQGITKLCDLTFLNRERVAKTFYDDLKSLIYNAVEREKVEEEYTVPMLENTADYCIDYRIEGKNSPPLFLFGAPSSDKAKLATIILLYLDMHNIPFEPLIVVEDMSNISKADGKRLKNASGKISSLTDSPDEITRIIKEKVA